ncbi:MAG: restriction endonuclease subunit S [Spirochaetia bacterium]|jgi:type I restriction enzyme S subunit|nr:restriction endonuclease subunit S [Spirochaetia bacterium]
MSSSYKRLGTYIREVNIRNRDLEVKTLLGVSIKKILIPSIANTVALLDSYDYAIVSQAYTVFEIIDHEKLNPGYLMMWIRRPEFDRYARFKSHGSAREIFNWDEMCEIELPVPSIKKQKAIIKEYNTIVDRIKLNEQLNRKLEETAQDVYKHWFVDFEFPVSKKYAVEVGTPEIEGKPYRSSGGEMVFNEELGKEIPVGWHSCSYTEIFDLKGGGTPDTDIPEYWNGEIPFFTPKDIGTSVYSTITEKNITDMGLINSSTKIYPKNTVFITARGTVGAVALASGDMAMNQSCYAALGEKYNQFFVHQHTLEILKQLTNEANGGVFGALVTKDFDGKLILAPPLFFSSMYKELAEPIYNQIFNNQRFMSILFNLREFLLAKMTKVGF